MFPRYTKKISQYPENVILRFKDFDSYDQEKYIEIPYDEWLDFLEICQDLPQSQIWLLELYMPNTEGIHEINTHYCRAHSNEQNQCFQWQITTSALNNPFHPRKLEPGHIINVLDNWNKWYEAIVTGKRIIFNQDQVEIWIAVHYIGWMSKWDEWINISNDEECERLQPRYTHSIASHYFWYFINNLS